MSGNRVGVRIRVGVRVRMRVGVEVRVGVRVKVGVKLGKKIPQPSPRHLPATQHRISMIPNPN